MLILDDEDEKSTMSVSVFRSNQPNAVFEYSGGPTQFLVSTADSAPANISHSHKTYHITWGM